MKRLASLSLAAVSLLAAAGCGADDPAPADSASSAGGGETAIAAGGGETEETVSSPGVRLVSAADGAAIVNDPPPELVVLDVRTPEEFADARIDGATMLDFYRDDFAEQLAGLDRDVPYLLYCRSGNRSGQASAAMETLGFTDVAEVDGGILAWDSASLPTVSG